MRKFEDFDIVQEGRRRYYVENLVGRDFYLENTTPHLLKIGDFELQENSWVEMIRLLAAYLLLKYPEKRENITAYQTSWTKSDIFSAVLRTNFKFVDEGLYVNCNHTAMHSLWLIQDLLDYFGEDKSKAYFLIHRPPAIEQPEVRMYYIQRFNKEFSFLLSENYGKNQEAINKIISNIVTYMNPKLQKISKGYNDFRLFDDKQTFMNYRVKFLKTFDADPSVSDKNKTIIHRYMDYLSAYYDI